MCKKQQYLQLYKISTKDMTVNTLAKDDSAENSDEDPGQNSV